MNWIKHPRPFKIRIGDTTYEIHAALSGDRVRTLLDKQRGSERTRTRLTAQKWRGIVEFPTNFKPWQELVEEEHAPMEKRRRHFVVEDSAETILAMGTLYDDGNVQVLWRKSIGWAGEQYHSIAQMFGIEETACTVRLVPELPKIVEP